MFDVGAVVPEPKTSLDGTWPGMTGKGNLDIMNRPSVQNPAGGESSIYSISINVDGREYLIPRVSMDGRLMSEEEAIRAFREKGQHLGTFDTPENATGYADSLHKQQAGMKYGGEMADPRDPGGALSAENRGTFRGSIPADIWQQMARYGMGQQDQWPDWRSIQGISEAEMPLLEALMLAFKKEQGARRPPVGKTVTLQPGDEEYTPPNAGGGYIDI